MGTLERVSNSGDYSDYRKATITGSNDSEFSTLGFSTRCEPPQAKKHTLLSERSEQIVTVLSEMWPELANFSRIENLT